MKKSFLFLVLALVLLLPFTLIGCGGNEDTDTTTETQTETETETSNPIFDEPAPNTESLLDNVVNLDKSKDAPNFSKVESFFGATRPERINEHFFYYTSLSYDLENNLDSTSFYFANFYNDTEITFTEYYDITAEDYDYENIAVDVNYRTVNDFIIFTIKYGNTYSPSRYDVYLYDRFGTEVAKRCNIVRQEKFEEFNSIDNHFNNNISELPLYCFDGILYYINEDSTLTKLTAANELGFDLYNLFYLEANDEFYLVPDNTPFSAQTVRFYNNKLELVDEVAFDVNICAAKEWTVVLNNHDIIYTELVTLPLDTEKWDAVYNGSKANVEAYLISASTGTKTAIETRYFPTERIDLNDGYYELEDKTLNLASYWELTPSGAFVQGQKLAVIGEDGKVDRFFSKVLSTLDYESTQNGMQYVKTEFGTYYVDENGIPYAPILVGAVHNNKWAIVGNEIYDKSANLIYTIDEETFELVKIMENSIILRAAGERVEWYTVTDTWGYEYQESVTKNTYTYYMFTGSDQLTKLYETSDTYSEYQLEKLGKSNITYYYIEDITSSYYIIRETQVSLIYDYTFDDYELSQTIVYKVYDDNGTLKETFEAPYDFDAFYNGSNFYSYLITDRTSNWDEFGNEVYDYNYTLYTISFND